MDTNNITTNAKGVQEHIKLGQEKYNSGDYTLALKEFNSAIKISSDNIEARIWRKRTQESIDKANGILPTKMGSTKIKELKELPGGQRYCLYCIKGDVSHRICSRLFQCKVCEFGQGMVDTQKAKLATSRDVTAKKEISNKSE